MTAEFVEYIFNIDLITCNIFPPAIHVEFPFLFSEHEFARIKYYFYVVDWSFSKINELFFYTSPFLLVGTPVLCLLVLTHWGYIGDEVRLHSIVHMMDICGQLDVQAA